MRNMSFMLTTEQIRNRTKTVTRRLGWDFLKPGDLIQAIEKGQGLQKGEKVNRLAVLRVESVRKERLDALHNYDVRDNELAKEGFPQMSAIEFESMFCAANRPCMPYWVINRIEFSYVDPVGSGNHVDTEHSVTARRSAAQES